MKTLAGKILQIIIIIIVLFSCSNQLGINIDVAEELFQSGEKDEAMRIYVNL